VPLKARKSSLIKLEAMTKKVDASTQKTNETPF
jgi:hypothetical protein